MTGPAEKAKPLTIRDIAERKRAARKIVMVTAYDALFGRLVDEAQVDIVLVGDSLGHVVQGRDSTLAVTLGDMIYHARAVRRGVTRALLVVDLPFLTYQVSEEQALLNAGRVMQETGAQAVKLEGGDDRIARSIDTLTRIGVPVMAHLGFTPQSVHALGGPRVQGREEETADRLIEDARRLEAAGAFSLVLELVPAAVARHVTESVAIPTIGIGAGAGCDGQVLVLPDLLGLNDRFRPKFLKRYANLADDVRRAVGAFRDEVRAGAFPDDQHSF
ncbi:MAG: 3-methyl-2-oxobutanoate hydroxymethyltransferase [Gemmatimonadaceae bacterium]